MQTNPFPAILLAGPPHSGKSVLAYLLTEHLRQLRISQYLLRAVPDGEGDWYQVGDKDIVHVLRSHNKHGYSSDFVVHMRTAIQQRWLPLLVDIGGKPQGEQFDLLSTCTHSILLYKEQGHYAEWCNHLAAAGLQPVAELCSTLDEPDQILDVRPVLSGTIRGLDRNTKKRCAGPTFGALLDRVSGIFYTNELEIERIHTPSAPFLPLVERELAIKLGIPTDEKVFWEPQHLTQLEQMVPAGQSFALYGRGPVWLAAMLAARALPAPVAIFDARFGWLQVPPVYKRGNNRLDVRYQTHTQGQWADIRLPEDGVLEAGPLTIAFPHEHNGIILSGKLPRWAFASLVRALAPSQAWVAVDDPAQGFAIVVYSNSNNVPVGTSLSYKNNNIHLT